MDSEDVKGWDSESERAWKEDPHIGSFPDVVISLLRQHLELGSLILDAGCGIGKNVAAFIRLGYRCDGVDQSPVGVKYSRTTNPKCNIRLVRIQELKDQDKYDMIFTSSVLQHNLHERKRAILKVFRAALKPDGFYLCTENTLTPFNIGLHYVQKNGKFHQLKYSEDATDGYSFTENGWSHFMAQNGFRHIVTIFPWPYYLLKVIK